MLEKYKLIIIYSYLIQNFHILVKNLNKQNDNSRRFINKQRKFKSIKRQNWFDQ
jgi:hypothetical protein